MNWYYLAKFSAIWDVNYYADSISSMIYAIYDLTYKLQSLKKHEFQGHPKRLDNIKLQLENSARTAIADLVGVLQPVFKNWLSGHALLDPRTWAAKRAKEWLEIGGDSPQSLAEMITFECDINKLKNKFNISTELHRLDEPVKNGQATVLHKLFETAKSGLIEYDTENAFYEANSNQEEINEEQIEAEIKQRYEEMPFSEYFDIYYGGDLAGFLNAASEMYDIEEICIEFAIFLCFPIWEKYWGPQGIYETRERVEKAYQKLLNVQSLPLGIALATINDVIGTCHQTGDMLDYISDVTDDTAGEIRHAMDFVTNNMNFELQDIELQEIGVQIPHAPINKKPQQNGVSPVPRNNLPQPANQIINQKLSD